MYAIAAATGFTRGAIQKKTNQWEIRGWIELKASGVQARYALTDVPLPQTAEEIDALAQELFDIGITRESRDLARLEKVVDTATASACEYSLPLSQPCHSHLTDLCGLPGIAKALSDYVRTHVLDL